MKSGYVKLYRKILDNPIIMKDAETFSIWIYLLLNAAHKEKEVYFNGKKIILDPGELITGTLKISKVLKINKDKIQRTLKCLEIDKQISQQTTPKGRIISVLNWELYQSTDKQVDKQLITKQEYKNISSSSSLKKYARVFNNLQIEYLEELGNEYDVELLDKAIEIYILNGKSNIKYIEGVLKNWKSEGINSLGDLVDKENKKEEPFDEELAELIDSNWMEDF